jgi:hypothetical protein
VAQVVLVALGKKPPKITLVSAVQWINFQRPKVSRQKLPYIFQRPKINHQKYYKPPKNALFPVVIGSSHPLNGGLGGYCRGNLSRVPRAIQYGPKLKNVISFLQRHTAGEPYTPYQEVTLPVAGWIGQPTKPKRN